MNKIFFGLLIVFAVILFTLFRKNEKSLVINNHKFMIEVADNFMLHSKGLSGRASLCKDCGMLFVYSIPNKYGFWMNQMKFNLDFVFINDNKVVDLVSNVPYPKKGESPKIINSRVEFDKVLEINQGVIMEFGFKVGDKIEY